jgi:3-oxoacyl-[acyl-carrier protein] reductase
MRPAVVVTGAAGGVGAALTRHLLGRGRAVVGLDLAPFPAPIAQASGFTGFAADIADEAAVEAAFAAAAAQGPIAALVANAAVTDLDHHEVLDLPYAIWARVLRVNLDGAFLTARAAARHMTGGAGAAGGNIVFVTSSLARLDEAKPGDAPYCASKAGVEMLARVLALELAPRRINVNTVFPRAILDTGFFAHWPADERRRRLRPPALLNAAVEFLLGLPPGAATGRSLDQELWDRDPAYRAEWGAA